MARRTKIKDKETKIDKQLKSYAPLIIGLAALVVVFLVLYYIFQGLGKVEYEGLTFTKERFGGILVYSYNYLVKSSDGKIMQRTLYLRNDPRYNDVPIGGEIIYPAGKRVYISINGTGLRECEDSLISIASLSNFLVNNNLLIRAGVPDENEAKLNNQTYVTCKNYPDNPVILLEGSSETKIEKSGANCYELETANCEILKVVEKFIVQSILDAKKTAA